MPLGEVENYRLREWSPDAADTLIELMHNYAENLPVTIGGRFGFQLENSARGYAAYALREAQLLFPNDARGWHWRKEEAASTGFSRFGHGGDAYRSLLLDGFNMGLVKPEKADLANWLFAYPTLSDIEVTVLDPLPGYRSSYLITLVNDLNRASTHWLLETPEGFIGYTLFDNLGDIFAAGYSLVMADLTGDGINDIINLQLVEYDPSTYGDPLIYDLGSAPPQRLSFGPNPPALVKFYGAHDISATTNDDRQVLILRRGLRAQCSPNLNEQFQWNGQWLELTAFEADFFSHSKECVLDVLRIFRGFVDFELERLWRSYLTTFGDVIPEGIDNRTGEPFAQDAQDEIRYTLAINHALFADQATANALLRKIIDSPAITGSSWIESAQEILDNYDTPEDIYGLCTLSKVFCDHQQALEIIIDRIPMVEYGNVIQRLQELGVSVFAHGSFDFEGDRDAEQWLITKHPGNDNFEFWIIAKTLTTLKAIYVDMVAGISPIISTYTPDADSTIFAPDISYAVFSIGTNDIYSMIRRKTDGEPFVSILNRAETLSSEAADPSINLELVIRNLLSGAEPKGVIDQLIELQKQENIYYSAPISYYLGLAHTLDGNEHGAIEAYLDAWQQCAGYCDIYSFYGNEIADAFSVMARAKLILVPSD